MPASKTDAQLIVMGGREVEINGETKVLFYDHTAQCVMGHEFRKAGFKSGIAAIGEHYGDYQTAIILLWSGLIHYGKGQTIKDFGNAFLDYNKNFSASISKLTELMVEAIYALNRQGPEPVEGESKAPLAPKKKKKSVTKRSGKGS